MNPAASVFYQISIFKLLFAEKNWDKVRLVVMSLKHPNSFFLKLSHCGVTVEKLFQMEKNQEKT